MQAKLFESFHVYAPFLTLVFQILLMINFGNDNNKN